jgi:hypothetical protein
VLQVPVFVESWQIECCGDPPGVGDRVEWGLTFAAARPGVEPGPVDGVRFDGVATLHPVGAGLDLSADHPVQLDAGPLHAYWLAPRPVTGPVQLAGWLQEDHHGALPYPFPRTAGTVGRVRVRTQEYVADPSDPQMFSPGGAPPAYRDVDRSPKHFVFLHGGGRHRHSEDGVLVDLLVRPTTPS